MILWGVIVPKHKVSPEEETEKSAKRACLWEKVGRKSLQEVSGVMTGQKNTGRQGGTENFGLSVIESGGVRKYPWSNRGKPTPWGPPGFFWQLGKK